MSAVSGGAMIQMRRPYSIKRYLSVSPGTQLYVGLITSVTKDSDTNGIVQLGHTAVSGSLSGVESSYTVLIGTSAGLRNVGEFRVRKTPTVSDFYVNETAPGEADVQVGHYLTVIEERRIWQKRIKHIETINSGETFPSAYEQRVDYDIAYVNQNGSGMPPKANITRTNTSRQLQPIVAGFVENGANYRIVDLSGFYSYATASGASISSYLWDVDDGTIIVGTATSHTITVTFPNTKKFRYVKLTVTDNNGTTGVMWLPIWVHNRTGANTPIANFKVARDERAEGRTMAFELYGANDDFDETVISHGSVICYWEEIFWNGYENVAPPDEYLRQFLGWITKRTETLKDNEGKLVLECGGPQAVLSKIYGYAQTVSDTGTTPTTWYEMNNISVNRLVTYMLRVYSNAVNVINVFLTARDDPVEGIEFDNSNIWDQIVKLIEQSYFSIATCDSLGSLWMQRHYSYLESADRSSRQTTYALTAQEWEHAQGLDIADEALKKVWWIEAWGSNWDILLDSSSNVINFSKIWKAEAPGKTQSYGTSSPSTPFQRLKISEDAKNDFAKLIGHHYARENNLRDNVTLKLIYNFDVVEPAWNEPITVTYTSGSVGGTDLNAVEFLVKSISVTHNYDYGRSPKEVTLTLEQATIGKPAEITDVEDAGLISSSNPSQPVPIDRPVSDFGTGTLILPNNDESLYITHNGSSSSPTWTRYPLSVSGNLESAVSDPFNPDNAWLLTTNDIYKLTAMSSTRTLTNQLTFGVPGYIIGGAIQTERGVQNHVVAVHRATSNQVEVYYTTNGSTWNGPITLSATVGALNAPGLYVSPWVAGKVISTGQKNDGTLIDGAISTNYGASFTAISSPDIEIINGAVCLHIPYSDTSEQTAYIGSALFGLASPVMIRVDGTVQTVITPTISGNGYFPGAQFSVDTPVLDGNRVVCTGLNSSSQTAVFVSRDRGATWRVVPGTELPLADGYVGVRCLSENPDAFFVFGLAGRIAYSSDFGVTLQDKRGNIPTDYPSVAQFLNVFGG